MARISGIDLPREKRIEVALTYIYGIGPARAAEVLKATGIDADIRVKDLTEEQEAQLRDAIEHNYLIEGDLMLNAVPFILIGAMVLLIPVLYLLRFADYVMMDQPELGALYAIVSSFHMTRRHFKALFKLDLRFWWYYALELLVVVISYGHMILDLAGVDIGIGGDTAMFVFYIASLAGQLGLYVWKKNTVFATYALAYDIIYLPSVSVKKQEN